MSTSWIFLNRVFNISLLLWYTKLYQISYKALYGWYLNLKYVMYLQCIWHSYSRNHYFASCIFNFLALIHDINSISILHYISLITTHLNIQRWDAFLAHLSFCIIMIFKYFFFIQISFLDLCTSFGDWFSIYDLIWLRGFMLYTR